MKIINISLAFINLFGFIIVFLLKNKLCRAVIITQIIFSFFFHLGEKNLYLDGIYPINKIWKLLKDMDDLCYMISFAFALYKLLNYPPIFVIYFILCPFFRNVAEVHLHEDKTEGIKCYLTSHALYETIWYLLLYGAFY